MLHRDSGDAKANPLQALIAPTASDKRYIIYADGGGGFEVSRVIGSTIERTGSGQWAIDAFEDCTENPRETIVIVSSDGSYPILAYAAELAAAAAGLPALAEKTLAMDCGLPACRHCSLRFGSYEALSNHLRLKHNDTAAAWLAWFAPVLPREVANG